MNCWFDILFLGGKNVIIPCNFQMISHIHNDNFHALVEIYFYWDSKFEAQSKQKKARKRTKLQVIVNWSKNVFISPFFNLLMNHIIRKIKDNTLLNKINATNTCAPLEQATFIMHCLQCIDGQFNMRNSIWYYKADKLQY